MEIPEDIRFSARIDGWGFEKMDGKSTVLYNIMIMSSNGHSWTVRRRYSEFRDNYLTIQYQFKNSEAAKFSFPRKTIIKTVHNADTRKEILQRYLNDLLKIVPVPVEVKYFLRITPKVLCLEDTIGSIRLGSPGSISSNASNSNSNSPYNFKNGTPNSERSIGGVNTPGSARSSQSHGSSPHFSTPSVNSVKGGTPIKVQGGQPVANVLAERAAGEGAARAVLEEGDSEDDLHNDLEGMLAGGAEGGTTCPVSPSSNTSNSKAKSNEDHGNVNDNDEDDEEEDELTASHLRARNAHSDQAIRAYTMDMLEEDGDDELEYDPSKRMDPRTAALLFILASIACLFRMVCMFVRHRYEGGPLFFEGLLTSQFTALGSFMRILWNLGSELEQDLTTRSANWSLLAEHTWGAIYAFITTLWAGIAYLSLGVYSALASYHHAFYWVSKTTIFWLLLISTFHRIIAFILTQWLQAKLMTPNGAFKFKFQGITLRLGLVFGDINEITVHNFIWENPPKFNKTEYFAKVGALKIKFDFMSLVNAIMKGDQMIVHDLEIDELVLHIERGPKTRDGLNLWACLGSQNLDDAASIKEGIIEKLTNAVSSTADGMMNVGGLFVDTLGSAGSTVFDGVVTGAGAMGDVVLDYNPLSLAIKAAKSTHNVNASNTSATNANATATAETNDNNDNNASDGSDESGRGTWKVVGGEDKVGTATVEAEVKKEEEEWHWGVYWRLKVSRLTCRRLTFYVKDFLAASHTDHKPIVINFMEMTEEQLWTPDPKWNSDSSIPKSKKPEKMGLYLDDLVWRLINKLIGKLLETNTFSLLGTVAGSGLNQALHGGLSGGKTGARFLKQTVYNYNPKEMANSTMRGLHYLRTIGAPKLTRSPSLQDMKRTTLRVALYAVRNLRFTEDSPDNIKYQEKLIKKRTIRESAHAIRKSEHKLNEDSDSGSDTEEEVISTLHYTRRGQVVKTDERKQVTMALSCKMQLCNQGTDKHSQAAIDDHYAQFKSSSATPEEDTDELERKVYIFGERVEMENLITLDAELHVRLFQSSVIKDTNMGEAYLALRDDFSGIVDAQRGVPPKSKKADSEAGTGAGVHDDHESSDHPYAYPRKLLAGLHENEEKVGWYLLYAKGSDESVGEVQLGMTLV